MKRFFPYAVLFIVFLMPSIAKADAIPLYFNAAVGTSWDDLASWWQDSNYTIPADELPNGNYEVYIDAQMNFGPSTPTSVSRLLVGTIQPGNDSYFTGDLTVTDSAVFGVQGVPTFNTTFTSGTLTVSGTATFYSTASNQGNIVGNAVFYEDSANVGPITGSADFYDNSQNLSGGSASVVKRRHFLQNITTTADYITDGPWTLVAENSTVAVGTAILDLDSGSPTFTTLQTIGSGTFTFLPPTVSSSNVIQVSRNSARLAGDISANGSQIIVEEGFIYGLTTAYGATTTDSGSFPLGSFVADVGGLLSNTTYHYKAFARNTTGTSYGSDKTFTTYPINAPQIVLLASTTTGTAPYTNAVVSTSTVVTAGFNCSCLTVHDVTNKTSPQVIATSSVSAGPNFVISRNNYVYVSAGSYLETWNFTNPASPTRLGIYSLPSGYTLGKMRIDQDHLFISFSRSGGAGPGGVKIFSIVNPATTTPTSTLLVGSNGSGQGDVLPIGNYVYVADYFGLTLSVFDISNISSPVLRQTITGITEPLDYHTFEPWGLETKGNALYLIDDNIVRIYDISSSTDMQYQSTVITIKDTEGFRVRDNLLYFAGSGAGGVNDRRIQIYDISDPFNPHVISDFFTGLNNYWISIDDDGYVYINSASENKLSIFSPIKTPVVVTDMVSGLSKTTVTLNASITSDNNSSSTDRGFKWGTTSSYGDTASTTGLFGVGSFSQDITGLSCGTTYHYQAFAINYIGMATTSDSTFTTSDCSSSTGTITSNSTSVGSSGGFVITAIFQPTSFTYQFVRNLTSGSLGLDVKNLQLYLNSKGFTIALSGPGSRGRETNFFGALTRKALIKFQKAHGISPAVGYFGPITRAFIAKNP